MFETVMLCYIGLLKNCAFCLNQRRNKFMHSRLVQMSVPVLREQNCLLTQQPFKTTYISVQLFADKDMPSAAAIDKHIQSILSLSLSLSLLDSFPSLFYSFPFELVNIFLCLKSFPF